MDSNLGLTQMDCDCLDRVLKRSTDALTAAQAFKECGWDVDVYIAKLQEQLDLAQKTKAKAFPLNT
jgi:hypothetical protein